MSYELKNEVNDEELKRILDGEVGELDNGIFKLLYLRQFNNIEHKEGMNVEDFDKSFRYMVYKYLKGRKLDEIFEISGSREKCAICYSKS